MLSNIDKGDIMEETLLLKNLNCPNCGAKIEDRIDRKSTRLNSSHSDRSRMPSSA